VFCWKGNERGNKEVKETLTINFVCPPIFTGFEGERKRLKFVKCADYIIISLNT